MSSSLIKLQFQMIVLNVLSFGCKKRKMKKKSKRRKKNLPALLFSPQAFVVATTRGLIASSVSPFSAASRFFRTWPVERLFFI